MSAADVLKMIQDEKVQFIDFRFTDTKGQGAAHVRAGSRY